MNHNFHSSPPFPLDICNLEATYASGNNSSAFIFEPKDLVPFELARAWQNAWQMELVKGASSDQAIWLLQHSSCYTLGRGSTERNLLFDVQSPPEDLYRVDRGGEVTFHTPGQLVGYLVLDLGKYQKDLHWYLRELERVIIDVLLKLGLEGKSVDGLTGVWIKDSKVAAIGVGCRRWITQHGLSINVDCELEGFRKIRPCGLSHEKIKSIKHWISDITVSDVQPLLKESLISRFGFVNSCDQKP